MDDDLAPVAPEGETHDRVSHSEDRSGKRHFDDSLLTKLMCPTPVVPPQGKARRIYGVMSDTPRSRRTRLYALI